jgi:hypothetical protein
VKSILLIIGGVIQVLIVALHIGIFYGIAVHSGLPANAQVTVHIFNAAVTVTVIFFAYVSLVRRNELIGTNLGRIVMWFIAVFYLQRGFVELFLRGFNPVNLGLSIIIAALYAVAAIPPKAEVSNNPAQDLNR